jgi:hypothetical protein
MGIYSEINVAYGFRIPERLYEKLLRRDPEDDEDSYVEHYIGDDDYTHELFTETTSFMYGKILYTTEARNYIDDGNREVVDVKKVMNLHHMQKKKIDRMAKQCRLKATYFTVAVIY